jgi:hypothetical protein
LGRFLCCEPAIVNKPARLAVRGKADAHAGGSPVSQTRGTPELTLCMYPPDGHLVGMSRGAGA